MRSQPRAAPALKVRIEGHTDNTGDAKYSMELSRRRADAGKNALVSEYSLTVEGLADYFLTNFLTVIPAVSAQ